ncbi:hypothetical protein [Paraburkholderia aromaticivorans]|uniref:hypothetical protein n=1 Tax=Paraburkholderia aromaticivorans TaxID=2026199 RepID=UPI0012FE3D6F|nr:hypothetical protein [Paraburkholderia aromaticivorans]
MPDRFAQVRIPAVLLMSRGVCRSLAGKLISYLYRAFQADQCPNAADGIRLFAEPDFRDVPGVRERAILTRFDVDGVCVLIPAANGDGDGWDIHDAA